jgi:hypothetical protein
MSLSSNWSAQCSGLQFVLTSYLVAFPQIRCEGSQCRHLVNVYCSSVGQHWQVAIKRGCCCLQKGENIRTSVAMRPRCQPCTAEAEAPRGTFKKRTEPTMPRNLRVSAAAVCKKYPAGERRITVQDGQTYVWLNSEVWRGPDWVFCRLIIKIDPCKEHMLLISTISCQKESTLWYEVRAQSNPIV